MLDEHLSPGIAEELRLKGRDVTAIAERYASMQMTDPAVIELAISEARAIVTANVRDFRPLCAELVLSGRGHPGLVLLASGFRRTRGDSARIARLLSELMDRHPGAGDLTNQEAWL